MADQPAKTPPRAGKLLAALMVAAGLLMGVYLLVSHEIFPRTDDAFALAAVQAATGNLTPRTPR
jgi:multidrug resistance efflux pump